MVNRIKSALLILCLLACYATAHGVSKANNPWLQLTQIFKKAGKKSHKSSYEDESKKEYYDEESSYGTRESLNIAPKYYANACYEMTLTDGDYDSPKKEKI